MVIAVQNPTSSLSARAFGAVASQAAWKQQPSWYVVAAEDGAINPDMERLMANGPLPERRLSKPVTF